MTIAYNNKLIITQKHNRFYVNGKLVITSIGKLLNSQNWDYIHPSIK